MAYRETFPELNDTLVIKIRDTISKGLVRGIGESVPGYMCVEAAICYAAGMEHSDDPGCVFEPLRRIKIALNDCDGWTSKETRAKGMLKLAISQLGTKDFIDNKSFNEKLKTHLTEFKTLIDNNYKDHSNYNYNYNYNYYNYNYNHYNYNNYYNDYSFCIISAVEYARYAKNFMSHEEVLIWFCNKLNQTLVELETPGSKFLYLLD